MSRPRRNRQGLVVAACTAVGVAAYRPQCMDLLQNGAPIAAPVDLPSIFDICAVCALSSANQTSPAKCNATLVDSECGDQAPKVRTIHVLPNTTLALQFSCDPSMFGFALAIPVCYAKNGLPDFIELFPDLSTLNETGIIFTRIPLNMSAGAGYALIFKQELKDSGQHNDSTLVYLHIDEDTSSWITSDSSSITSVSSLQPSVTSVTDDNHTISNSSDGSDSHLNGFAGTLWTSVLVGLTAIGCCLIAYVFIRKWVKGLRSNAAIGSDLAKMQVEFAVTVAAEENQDCQDNSEDEVEVFRPHSACSLGDGKVECEGVQSILKQSTVLGRQQRYRNYDRGSPVGMGVGYGGGIGIASGVDSISGRGMEAGRRKFVRFEEQYTDEN